MTGSIPPWSPPAGLVKLLDRRNPRTEYAAHIPQVLDWLRTHGDVYTLNSVEGMLISADDTGITYRVDAEPAYNTPGTWENYTLTSFGLLLTYAGESVDEIELLPGLNGAILTGRTLQVGLDAIDLGSTGGTPTVSAWGTPNGNNTSQNSGGIVPRVWTFTAAQAGSLNGLRLPGSDLNSPGAADIVAIGAAISVSAGGMTRSGTLTAQSGLWNREFAFAALPFAAGDVVTVNLNVNIYNSAIPYLTGSVSADGAFTYTSGPLYFDADRVPWIEFDWTTGFSDGTQTTGLLDYTRIGRRSVMLAPYALAEDLIGLGADLTTLVNTVAGDLSGRITTLEGRSVIDAEAIQDTVATMLGTVGTYNDAAGTYTITLPAARTDEEIQDVVAALIAISGGAINKTYDDAGNVLTLTVTGSGGSGDMVKTTYDTNNSGVVDNSERLNNVLASSYLRNDTTQTATAEITYELNGRNILLRNPTANKIWHVEVDNAGKFGIVETGVAGAVSINPTTQKLNLYGNDVVVTNDTRLSDARTPTAHTHVSTDITDFTEASQDVLGAILADSTDLDYTYNDAANTETATVTGLRGKALPAASALTAGLALRVASGGTSFETFTPLPYGGSAPTTGQALLWNDTNARYEPGTVSSGGGGLSSPVKLSAIAAATIQAVPGNVMDSTTTDSAVLTWTFIAIYSMAFDTFSLAPAGAAGRLVEFLVNGVVQGSGTLAAGSRPSVTLASPVIVSSGTTLVVRLTRGAGATVGIEGNTNYSPGNFVGGETFKYSANSIGQGNGPTFQWALSTAYPKQASGALDPVDMPHVTARTSLTSVSGAFQADESTQLTSVAWKYSDNTVRYANLWAFQSLRTTASLNFPSIAAQSSFDLTIAVTGASIYDVVQLGLPAAPAAGIVFNAWVSSAGTVTIRATNVTAAAVDPPSAIYAVLVTR